MVSRSGERGHMRHMHGPLVRDGTDVLREGKGTPLVYSCLSGALQRNGQAHNTSRGPSELCGRQLQTGLCCSESKQTTADPWPQALALLKFQYSKARESCCEACSFHPLPLIRACVVSTNLLHTYLGAWSKKRKKC